MQQQGNKQTQKQHWSRIAAGAAFFILAAFIYVLTEAVSAAAWHDPPYFYGYNYISDLGVAKSLTIDGREVLSPLAAVMNFGFQAHGILFALGYLLVLPLFQGKMKGLVCAAAVIHGIGNFMVGYFPGESYVGVNPHVIGAGMAILGGNLTLIFAGLAIRRSGRDQGNGRFTRVSDNFARLFPRLSVIGVGLGSFGILNLAMMVTKVFGYPAVFERLSVYTMTAWDLIFGFCLLAACFAAQRKAA